MSEEKTKADSMSWDEHLKAGMDGLKTEIKENFDSRQTMNTVRKHSRAAMKEMLMAWRSLIDGALERIDDTEKPDAQRVTKIKID